MLELIVLLFFATSKMQLSCGYVSRSPSLRNENVLTKTFSSSSPEVVSIRGSGSLAELNSRFHDPSLSLVLPVPSIFMTRRFRLTKIMGTYHFTYRVRESFRALVDKVTYLCSEESDLNGIRYLRYIGSTGAGRSHNLAALASYLRVRNSKGLDFAPRVVYISSCELFFQDPACSLEAALNEAFPEELDDIAAAFGTGNDDDDDWEGLMKFVRKKPKLSILFIFDGWDYVNPEMKYIPEEQSLRIQCRGMLSKLSYGQYRIEAISAGSSILTSHSDELTRPPATDFIYLSGGLTDLEWQVWKTALGTYSAEEEAVVRDLTGLVPLYLTQLQKFDGDLSQKVEKFEESVGLDIRSALFRSSDTFLASCEEQPVARISFLEQMHYAVVEAGQLVDETIYDHRFFYREGMVLRPVSDLVRRYMKEYLDAVMPEKDSRKDDSDRERREEIEK